MQTPAVEVARDGAAMPAPEEVEQLYAAASAGPPLHEPPSVARSYAGLHRASRGLPGAVAVWARQGSGLAGLAHGHAWSWAEATDAWSAELRARLGTGADALEGSFAVPLLAVAPASSGAGLGRRLLDRLLAEAGDVPAWLVTTDRETPALRLYRSAGWRPLGYGPDAPDGRPGLVLVHDPVPAAGREGVHRAAAGTVGKAGLRGTCEETFRHGGGRPRGCPPTVAP